MRTLHWFRTDLRAADNTAFYHACQQATDGCLAVYIITPATWQAHDMAACQVDFILRGLHALQQQLAALNVELLVVECPRFEDTPALLLEICQQYQITAVHFNQQYEINEQQRDAAVSQKLKAHHIKVHMHRDQTIIAPNTVLTQQNKPFSVFTSFKKAWIHYYQQVPVALLPLPKKQKTLLKLDKATNIPTQVQGFNSSIDPALWPAGEAVAVKRLQYFIDHIIINYHTWRDYPAIDGTSKLSPYLATGMISARQCLHAALTANSGQLDKGQVGITTWINELIWREFYKDILVNFPRVCRNQPFKLETKQLQWHNNLAHFNAWTQGQTGYPIVDAAMRQLQQTGWMHNRLRMIVAMFFTKNLWLDWRLGEQFFMQHLIDGDFSANNGGWQWSASTGNDAAPYFRIFNPYTQSEKFDPEGKFIRQYCPELENLDNKLIHQPYTQQDLFSSEFDYPAPIVNYKTTREQAIKAFKQLKEI
jgi:deoxyribodipyrimidine photo-lyase